jgi:linoleoyl-CoA desaturase
MNANQIRFPSARPEFFPAVTKRVNDYFKSQKLSRYSNREMVLKTIFMFSLFLVPYFLMISLSYSSYWIYLGFSALMGFGVAGIGLSIMHDANHGSYSSKAWVNKLLGLSLNLVGGHSFNWIVQHNVLHHTYTNIHEADEDISPRGVLRMSPDSDWKKIHKYQHLYAWFLYGLLTFVWIIFKDFVRLIRYQKDGLVKKQKASLSAEWTILIATKLVYVTYSLIIPVLVTPFSFLQVFLGFFLMHYISGFILAIIFQPAHVIEGTEYPQPDLEGNMENSWAIHQMHTTTNFGHREKLFSWYVGGLNYQVEHHLFPNICHVHYRNIAPIVEKTALEFGVPYKSYDTFLGAIAAHARLLKTLGVEPQPVAPVAEPKLELAIAE